MKISQLEKTRFESRIHSFCLLLDPFLTLESSISASESPCLPRSPSWSLFGIVNKFLFERFFGVSTALSSKSIKQVCLVISSAIGVVHFLFRLTVASTCLTTSRSCLIVEFDVVDCWSLQSNSSCSCSGRKGCLATHCQQHPHSWAWREASQGSLVWRLPSCWSCGLFLRQRFQHPKFDEFNTHQL